MVAGSFEDFVSFEQGGVEFIGALDRGFEDRAAKTMDFGAGGVEDEEALGGEGFGVELCERLAEGATGLVSGDEGVHRVGGAEEFPSLIDEGLDGFVDYDAADGDWSRGGLRVDELAKFFSGREGDVIDFGKVVIFRCEPENGDVRMSG